MGGSYNVGLANDSSVRYAVCKKKKKGNFWRVAILGGRKYGIPQGPGFAYHGPFCIPWACRIRGMVCMIRVGVAQSQQTLRNMYVQTPVLVCFIKAALFHFG